MHSVIRPFDNSKVTQEVMIGWFICHDVHVSLYHNRSEYLILMGFFFNLFYLFNCLTA